MKKRSSSSSRKFQAIFAWLNRYFTGYIRWVPQWTVLRLFCYCQNHGFGSPREPHQLPSWTCTQLLLRETFLFYFFFCSLLWREPFCLTEYLRGRSKITVFKNQLRIRREHFDPLLLGVCFIGTHFLKIHPSFFFSGRVPRTLVNKYALSFRTLPLETGQLEWICCLLGAQCRTFYSVMAWFLIPGGGGSL